MDDRSPSADTHLADIDLARPPASRAWHALSATAVAAMLDTDPERGLSPSEAADRLSRHGPNRIEVTEKTRWWAVLARQFYDVLILILLVAAAISIILGEFIDAGAILLIVVLNGVLGFVQEWRAERAIEALQRMLAPHTRVLRGGQRIDIEAEVVVPGDVVVLDVGDRVPADLRLIAAVDLRVDESILTGESISVHKRPEPVGVDTSLAERSSILWMGTTLTTGRASAIAVATGMASQFGRIAELTQAIDREPTPLQRKLADLGRKLGILALIVSAAVAIGGILRGNDPFEMFLTGVSLAVAVVPEGLPAVVTITLALGIRAMARRRALLRRLQAAETLGAATVICTDKTGTLTQNEMTVRRVWLPGGPLTVTGVGYAPQGEFREDGSTAEPALRSDLMAMSRTGLVCNHAQVDEEDGRWRQIGEPTEAALVVLALKAGLQAGEAGPIAMEFAFTSERKRMTVIEHRDGDLTAHVKGAPEAIIERSSKILDGDTERPLEARDRIAATAAYESFAAGGLRTLALARRALPPPGPAAADAAERELTLLGIVGILDPPRPEVPAAVALAHRAGIKVVMITGDAAPTATAIADRVGLGATGAVAGRHIGGMTDHDLLRRIDGGALFYRTSPEDKFRIVRVLQEAGHVAAMTGDGVNDAPALKKADIGIAMGIRGTDVAKGASDMVLTDDNFASIVGAVEEGRRQFDNIKKFVRYLLSSNMGEVTAIFLNILLGGPLILLPVQILWMNLVTDGLTAVALGVEPAEKGLMSRPPRDPGASIISRRGAVTIGALGGYIGLTTLVIFQLRLDGTAEGLAVAQTMAFTGMVLLELMNVFNFRTLRAPMRQIGFFSNPWLLVAWAATIALQVAVVYLPFLQRALHTVPLGAKEWLVMIAAAVPIFLLMEVYKIIAWRRQSVPDSPSPGGVESSAALS